MERGLGLIGKYSITIVVFLLWATILTWWTQGFTAFTSYSYTLKSAGPLPRRVPDFALINQFGKDLSINSLRGKYILLQFMYLSCPDICGIVSSKQQQVYDKVARLIPEQLILLSVSFNPDQDTAKVLFSAWNHFGAKKGWLFTSIQTSQKSQIDHLLANMGVWVYKKPDGSFNHSSYLFLISPNGFVINVIEADTNMNTLTQTIKEAIL